ncbi:MAG TPA: hypothetical protein VH083_02680 [Myxococcales bacterium]|jgi:hypothetical protein|nr:hypothetical protein [Myxococcales bacterium]
MRMVIVFLLCSFAAAAKDAGQAARPSENSFDPVMVKEAARRFAMTVAARFPRIEGELRDPSPARTSACHLSDLQHAFAGQIFEIEGKGTFELRNVTAGGFCGGAYTGAVADGDRMRSLPLAISLTQLRAGPGTDLRVAKAFSDEAREALKSQAALAVSNEPVVTLTGSISGPRSNQVIALVALDQDGRVLEWWQLFERLGYDAPPPAPFAARARLPLQPNPSYDGASGSGWADRR